MKKTIALAALLPLTVAGWTVTHRSLALVDVQEAGGHRIVVPVPLPLAHGAALFAPDELEWVEVPEGGEYLPDLARVMEALEAAPDGPLLEATDGSDHVSVYKEDGVLHLRAREDGESRVELKLSFGTAEAVFEAYDEERGAFDMSALVSALHAMPRGQVVHVHDGGDEVSIRMW